MDFDGYKNMVGAFYQPKLVYIATNTLKTLTKREFLSGMGEVIKYQISSSTISCHISCDTSAKCHQHILAVKVIFYQKCIQKKEE